MKSLKLLDNLINIMEIVDNDHEVSFKEIQNVYQNLYRRKPELFVDKENKNNKPAWSSIKKTDKQYRHRCYVKTVFSGIEALSYCIKRIALSGYLNADKSIKEYAESEYKKLLDKKFSFEEKINYSFRLFSKIHSNYEYEIGNKNWTDFINTIKIRHRVTHPKSKKDFYLSRKDIKEVNRAYNLFMNELEQLIKIWK